MIPLIADFYTVDRVRGRVADLCYHCFEPRAMKVLWRRRVPHLYFVPIPLGAGKGTELLQCEACRSEFGIDPEAYDCYLMNETASLEELCDTTNPTLVERVAAYLDLIDDIRDGGGGDERADVFAALVSPVAWRDQARRERGVPNDGWSWLAMLISVGVVAIGVWLEFATGGVSRGAVPMYFVTSLVMAVGMCVWVVGAEPARRARRLARRELAPRLAPLNPTDDDLTTLLAYARSEGWALTRGMTVARLRGAIDEEHREDRSQ